MTTAPATPMSARAVRRTRRRAALGRFWASFRRERAGLVGLAVLAVFVLLALTAPLLFSLAVVVANIVADIVVAAVDPRVRT